MFSSIGLKTKIIIVAALVTAGSVAQAEPQAIIESRFSGQVAAPNNTGCPNPYDAMNVSIFDDGKKLADEDFCSSYGLAKAKTFTTRSGHTFALVEIGEGRGTNARINNLTVYRLHTGSLDEVLSIPISWPTSLMERFTYEYAIADDPLGGLEITLDGRDAAVGDECCVPPEKTQIIRIDQ